MTKITVSGPALTVEIWEEDKTNFARILEQNVPRGMGFGKFGDFQFTSMGSPEIYNGFFFLRGSATDRDSAPFVIDLRADIARLVEAIVLFNKNESVSDTVRDQVNKFLREKGHKFEIASGNVLQPIS